MQGLIFFIIVKCIICALIKNEESAAPAREKKRALVCYVNHRKVGPSHLLYYLDLLGLNGRTDIDDTVIEEAVFDKLAELDAAEGDVHFCDRQDILAAGNYILDSWKCHVMLN